MNKLDQVLWRLYRVPPATVGAGAGEIDLVDPAGRVQGMVIGFDVAGDWPSVERLYLVLQDELHLPAPAVAASGRAGYQLWLSLAEGISVADAGLFLAMLRQRYLANLPPESLWCIPDSAGQGRVGVVPALDNATGKWSAFIDPTMGSMFVEEPGLDMAPNMERQADLLNALQSIEGVDFHRAFDHLSVSSLQSGGKASNTATVPPVVGAAGMCFGSSLSVGGPFTDPRDFLLAVMNDAYAAPEVRVSAATALLPFFHQLGPESSS